MVPMITAPKGETMSQPAVMPTNPARMPFSVRDKEGLPYSSSYCQCKETACAGCQIGGEEYMRDGLCIVRSGCCQL